MKLENKSISQLTKELDRVFSIFIRQRDSDSQGYITCVSCKKKVRWEESNNCHFADRQHKSTRWDEINCNAGCVKCNAFDKGFHIHEYGKFLDKKYGKGTADDLIFKSRLVAKFTKSDLIELINKYKKLIK